MRVVHFDFNTPILSILIQDSLLSIYSQCQCTNTLISASVTVDFHLLLCHQVCLGPYLNSGVQSGLHQWSLNRGMKSKSFHRYNVLILPLKKQNNLLNNILYIWLCIIGHTHAVKKKKCIDLGQQSAVPSHLCPHLKTYSPALFVKKNKKQINNAWFFQSKISHEVKLDYLRWEEIHLTLY